MILDGFHNVFDDLVNRRSKAFSMVLQCLLLFLLREDGLADARDVSLV